MAATRAFYGDFAPAWLDWWVIGAFSAMGERRGMETSMEPERGVDLKFKVQINNREVAWKKVSGKTKNNDTLMDMRVIERARILARAVFRVCVYEVQLPDSARR